MNRALARSTPSNFSSSRTLSRSTGLVGPGLQEAFAASDKAFGTLRFQLFLKIGNDCLRSVLARPGCGKLRSGEAAPPFFLSSSPVTVVSLTWRCVAALSLHHPERSFVGQNRFAGTLRGRAPGCLPRASTAAACFRPIIPAFAARQTYAEAALQAFRDDVQDSHVRRVARSHLGTACGRGPVPLQSG